MADQRERSSNSHAHHKRLPLYHVKSEDALGGLLNVQPILSFQKANDLERDSSKTVAGVGSNT